MSYLNRAIAMAAGALFATVAYAENAPYMVQDMDGLATPSSGPRNFTLLDERFVFAASTPELGNSLWISDGTSAGTTLLRSSLLVGSEPGFKYWNGEYYFAAAAEPHTGGLNLWATDGTPAGTRLVKELPSPYSDTMPFAFVEFNGRLHFSIMQRVNGVPAIRIWTTDGTEQGTTVFFESNRASPLAVVGGRLLFTESDAATGSEFWTTDGTPEGTARLIDLYPGPQSGFWRRLTVMNGYYYFLGRDPTHGIEMWRTDGTVEGTTIVRDIEFGTGDGFPFPNSPPRFAVMGDRLYFVAHTFELGTELWRTDGTPAGTELVVDFRPGRNNGVEDTPIGATQDRVFFQASPSSFNSSIAVTDGTAAGTTTVIPNLATASGLIQTAGNLAFIAGQFTGAAQLWRSDGTPQGTYALRASAAANLAAVGDQVALTASDSEHGTEPWLSDGTVDGTRMLADVASVPCGNPAALRDIRGRLFYSVVSPGAGAEPFTTRGTPETTGMIADIRPGPDSSAASDFRAIEDGAIFRAATSSGTAAPLWRTDASGKGATLVDTAPPMWSLTSYALNGYYYGVADTGIWRTNGYDSHYVATGGYSLLGTLGNQLLLVAPMPPSGWSIWVGDGTDAGTVIDLPPGASDYGRPEWIGARGDRAYFYLSNAPGTKIYSTDGTLEGTRGVPGGENTTSVRAAATSFHDALYLGITINNVPSLIALDGPDAAVRVILAGVTVSSLAAREDLLYIGGSEAVSLPGLWVSDGTAAGTSRIPGITPDFGGADPDMLALGDAVYFRAGDDEHGIELWRSRGTAESTELVADINAGPNSSNPSGLTASGDRLYFSANDGVHGTELWALVRDIVGDIDGDGDNDLQDLSYLLANFGGPGSVGDLDGDGDVDLQDLSDLLANFGDSVEP